ncbi:LLM class F420-dependent oxidoreductase [Phycicoccus sonneratiae]|uniref:LLM class F420-dependent oxidoreductase n=1 Tax=Phycicoccus sonneratiae TaxID=2807628 RepID=A0ABS2CRM8_9MICO|nr:LLM class F420-dependent oxidoreductase [Phycicoccus sonneraticus]MBM6401739.1 LLM class F420-dependent oxidoreductase [Phycicoccus sonneraticus]
MTRFGFTLMTEQNGPKELVDAAVRAEDAGFDLLVSSDHFSPWLTEQGHAPYAWTVLGAVAQATSRVEMATYITCPTMRYHPAVVAQKAATLQVLADGRFVLGLGSGENLNEHVIGQGWPPVAQRQDMLAEAIEVIRALHTGELVTWRGEHFDVDSARIWDLPEQGVEIGVAVSGREGIERFGPLADHLIAVEPDGDLVSAWDELAGSTIGSGARAIGQIPICWDPSEEAAVQRAHEQFRWFAGGWKVNADLPTPMGFSGASQFVRPEDVAGSIPCGPDLDGIVEAVRPFWEAGFTDVALVQVGGEHQQPFLDEVAPDLLERLRAAAPSS